MAKKSKTANKTKENNQPTMDNQSVTDNQPTTGKQSTTDKQSYNYQLTINSPIEKGYTHEHIFEVLRTNFPTLVYVCMADEKGSCFHTHIFLITERHGITPAINSNNDCLIILSALLRYFIIMISQIS